MKKNLALLLICAFAAIQLWAVPADPNPIQFKQPDGTEITIRIRGDEKINWHETLDGYTLMFDDERYLVYATADAEGNLVPSTIRYYENQTQSGNSETAQFLAITKKGLFYSESQVNTLLQLWNVVSDAQEDADKAPILGTKKALCVLMSFRDRPMVKTNAEFNSLINQVGYATGGAYGSVRDFFIENSYGQMTLEVTVVGPYTTQNNMSSYVTNSGYRAFAAEAARAADADVNYNDFAVNGTLETFHIIFAGYGDEAINNGQQIWSHKWQLASPITLDGVRISVYSCSPELRGSSGTNLTYIGVICHELTHVFGSPDYYDTGSTGYIGTGSWDLMAGGSWNGSGNRPAHINMFQKILFGWVTPEELTSSRHITNMPNSAQNPVAYTVTANSNGEMYVLENRQRVGYDSAVPGHGLLIYHVHRNALTGNGSNASHPQQLYPVCASATTKIPTSSVSSYGSINSGGCPFPGTANKTSFTDDTTPAAFYWSGSSSGGGINKPITEITETGNLISFYFMKSSVPVTGVTVTPTTANLTVGGATQQLTANVLPSNAGNKDLTWTSSHPAIASVSATGLVTGRAAGAATITVKTVDGNFTATCTVNVTFIPVTGVTIIPTTLELGVTDNYQLRFQLDPPNASNNTATLSSNKPDVATVSPTGVVTAIAEGAATITVTTADGGHTATCAVTVTYIEPELEELRINGNVVEIPSGSGIISIEYLADCSENALELNIEGTGEITITVGGSHYLPTSTIPFSGDKVEINIKIQASGETINYKIIASRALGSASTPMYIKRWGNTLAVINNPANNGGYKFNEFRWFNNGNLTENSKGYISLSGQPESNYAAEVLCVSTNAWHKLCSNYASEPVSEMLVYPNPVNAGQQLNIALPDGVDKVSVRVYDMHGNMHSQHTNIYNSLTMPEKTGMYVLHIQMPDGTTTIQKVIVK